MFDQLFTSTRAVERYSSGALLEERRRYLAHCAAQGSTRSSLRLIAQHQLVAIEYLHLATADSLTVEEIRAAAEVWVGRQPQPHTHNATDYRHARGRFISDARQWLSFLGRLRTVEAPRRAYTYLVEEFANYMVREKGLSPCTVRIRCWCVGQFLDRFWERHRSFDEVTLTDIDAAIARKGTQDGYARPSIQNYVNARRCCAGIAHPRRRSTGAAADHAGLRAVINASRLSVEGQIRRKRHRASKERKRKL